MMNLWPHLREAVRVLRRSPGFTAGASLTLAIAIGATAAIFSLFNAALLRPLPFSEPDALVTYWVSSPQGSGRMEWTEGHVAAFRARSRTLDGLAAYDGGSGFNLTGTGDPVRLSGTTVTHDFFRVLGGDPLLGRTFLAEEDARGSNHVAILSHALWESKFAADPGVVGRAIRLNDVPTVIVGVMPPRFEFPNRTDLWVPVGLDPGDFSLYYLEPIARLAPGVSAAVAEREINALWRGESGRVEGLAITVRRLAALVAGEARTPLVVLLGAALLVLLVACANLANLMLVRANRRAGEMALRISLGATAGRVSGQLLAESAVLAALGGAGGLVIAGLGIRVLRMLVVRGPRIEQLDLLAVPLPRVEDAGLDAVTVGFTIGWCWLSPCSWDWRRRSAVPGLSPSCCCGEVEARPRAKAGG